MNEHDRTIDSMDEPRMPERLAGELRGLYRPGAGVPERVDRAVLSRAAGRMRKRGLRRHLRWAAAAGAVAAGLAVAVWVQTGRGPDGEMAGAPARAAAAMDFDGNGRVDIVDALQVARAMEADGGQRWDVNGDGTVDQADVDAVAMRAVRLTGEGVGS